MPPRCEPLCHFGDRLYFTSFANPLPSPESLNRESKGPKNSPQVRPRPKNVPAPSPDDNATYYYFTIDDQLLYLSFFQDWGPLNLAMVYRSCILIHELLQDEDLLSHRLVLYSSNDPRKKANAALLMALYVMIVGRRAPWEAFQPLAEVEFIPFRDAGRGPSDFNLNIQDCLWGMWKAMQNGLCDMNEFSVEDYEYYEKVENGDWNWITPNFIAFASPVDSNWLKKEKGEARLSLGGAELALQRKLPQPYQNCLDYFEKRNVKLVIRLNTQLYDRDTFIDRGIDHMELYFDDGTNPTDEIVRTFIDVVDKIVESGGAIAVHCKAGLGRTGTLIGAYLIWKYGFTANEAIAFMRIVRPGSVVGPQQQYMYLKQLEWTKWSAADEIRRADVAKNSAPSADSAAEDVVADKPIVAPATPPAETDEDVPMPPVTPSRHVAAAQARAREIEPPGQPRKTPKAIKRLAVESDDEEESADKDEEMDVLPTLNAGPSRKMVTRGSVKGKTKAGITASEARPTRVTRSTAGAAVIRKTGTTSNSATTSRTHTKSSSVAANAVNQSPNKIPRLATTRSTAAARAAMTAQQPVPVTRRMPAPPRPPLSPVPSRLPTLKSKQTASMTNVTDGNTTTTRKGTAPDAWMSTNAANSVVAPRNKSERPGLRNVKKRRSSFSAADLQVA